MAENKKNRKSNRSFRLEKKAGRHFEIEKEIDVAPVMPENAPVNQPAEPVTGNNGGNEGGSSSMKWVIVVLIIVAIAACAYFLTGGNKDNGDTSKDIPQTEQSSCALDSETAKDSVANSDTVTDAVPESDAEPTATPAIDENVGEPSANQTQTPAKEAAQPTTSPAVANAPLSDNVVENARRVIRGDFGSGEERKAKLGTSYSEIQSKVNEMYRKGLVR